MPYQRLISPGFASVIAFFVLTPAGQVLAESESTAAETDSTTVQRDDTKERIQLAAADQEPIWLNPVVTTANRVERTWDRTLSSMSLVGRDEFDRQQPRQIAELLRGRPGIDVISNGPFGKTTSLYIRGTNSDHALMLVDGIRMGSVSTGGASWQFLPPSLIERMEIVRGPRGSIYGADALGGVINVFTRESDGEFQSWAESGAGSFGTTRAGGGFEGGNENTRFSIGGSRFETDGIALRPGGEDKGYDNSSFVGRFSHDFDSGVSLGFTSLHSQGTTEYQGGVTDYAQQALGTRLTFSPASFWDSTVTFSRSLDEAETLPDGGTVSRYDTTRDMLRWQNSLYAGDHEFVVGGDHRDDQLDSSESYPEDSRSNTGVFAQALLDFSPVSLEAGVRQDDNEAYGETTTGSFGAGYQLNDSHRLRVTWGEGFKAPSFNSLYFPGYGNPDLEPEESRTVELGVSGRYSQWFWDAVAYETKADNLIEAVFAGGVFQPENVNEARIQGAEFGTGAEVGPWQFYGALSYTDPENRQTGNRLRRRAKESARVEVDRELGDWSLGASLIAQGHRYDDEDEQVRLGGFGLLNLRAGWAFARNWEARLTVDNALDKDYVTARNSFDDFDYQQPGRSVFLRVKYDLD